MFKLLRTASKNYMLAKTAIKTAKTIPGVAPLAAKAAQSLPGVGGVAGTVGKSVKSVKYMRYAVNGVLSVGAVVLGRALYENTKGIAGQEPDATDARTTKQT